MRFISTTIALIAFPVATFAAPAPQPVHSDNFNGFYAGIQGGYESFNIDSTLTGAGALAGDSANAIFGGDGGTGGIFAGYGERINRDYYLGAELEADIGGASSNNSFKVGATTAEADAKHKYDLGASLRAGVFPTNDTLLYGRIGAVSSKFDSNGTENPTMTGLRLGLGSETAISPNMTVRADWVYTTYQSKSWSLDNTGDTLSVSPTSNTFRIGVAYSF